MAQYKLTYFDMRGRGESIRLLLNLVGQNFIDNRIQFQSWPQLKPNTPFGHLPTLEVNEGGSTIVLAQSATILRYLGRKFNLAGGETDLHKALAEMYADQVTDVFNEMVAMAFEKDPAAKAKLESKLKNETIPTNMKLFENRLAQTNSYLAGRQLSYADIYLFSVLESIDAENRSKIFQMFPRIKGLFDQIGNIPAIKAYIARRVPTPM